MLNDMQQKIVTELDRNILLLALAGTGKTNTLTARISNILDSKLAKPEEILCITFTNKACREMKDRITSCVEGGEDVEVKTFHSLCFDIIKTEAKKNTDTHSEFTIYDEEDCLYLTEEYIKMGIPAKETKSIIDFIKESRLHYGFISPSIDRDLIKTVKKLDTDEERKNNFLGEFKKYKHKITQILKYDSITLLKKYQQHMKQYGAVDFQDLIAITSQLFENPEIVTQIANKYKYINIDEIQDTSLVEYNLMEKIFGNSKLLLCGDTFQTIYEWRGSNPSEIIKLYKKTYNPLEISFNKNYRATKTLTNGATEYLRKAFPFEYRDKLRGGLESNSEIIGEKIGLHIAGNLKQEASWIFNQIEKLPSGEQKKCCILTRNNKYNISLSKELRKLSLGKINFALIDDSKFFRKKEVKDVIAFLRLLMNSYDGNALKRIMRIMKYKNCEGLIGAVESCEFREAGINITDYIDETALRVGDKYSFLEEELANNNVVVFDVESTGTDTTQDEIIQIAAIRINSKGEEVERFMEFLKPNKSVGSSKSVHGFSDEFLNKEGKDKAKVLNRFVNFIKDKTLVGHNVQYDINILTSELSRHGLQKAEYTTFYDTLDIYRRFYPNLENHKLNTLSVLINTEHQPNHNALFDILATGELLVDAVNKHISPTSTERKKLMEYTRKEFFTLSSDINELISQTAGKRPYEIIQMIVKRYKFIEHYGTNSEEADNLRDFYFASKNSDDKSLNDRDSLISFTTTTTLSDGEMEKILLSRGKIPILTVHQSKGLEFDYIFLAGLNEHIFPNTQAIKKDSLDEEKRVMYVALTRAKKQLYISYSKFRRGSIQKNSRFLNYIDRRYMVRI